MKKLFVLVFALVFASFLSACNTVHGFGKDVEKVGEKISNASNK
ncbi:entericidin A/B family lipoprotein [Chitinivorax sp. PXF-14]